MQPLHLPPINWSLDFLDFLKGQEDREWGYSPEIPDQLLVRNDTKID
jgi:hypothetical protein